MGYAVLHLGARTISDLAELDLGKLLDESGLAPVAGEIELAPAVGALRPEVQFGSAFAAAIRGLGERRRLIALQRTYSSNPEKLAALGDQFGVSRERARQLEVSLRQTVSNRVGDTTRSAAEWLKSALGPSAPTEDFQKILALAVGDVPAEYKEAAEVALMEAAGYEYMDGAVGDADFRLRVKKVRGLAPGCANEAGVVDETELRRAAGGGGARQWELLVRSAGLVRIGESLVIRDTRRARIFLALEDLGEPATRTKLAAHARLADNTTLSSLLSSDPLFVRLTKDKWGLSGWTDDPYEGVVTEIVKRINRAGGEIAADVLVDEIPSKFEVLPATVRNYLSTRKFTTRKGMVRVVQTPVAPPQPLSEARDVVWTRDGEPALRFQVGAHHLKGNSQKVSMAVAQHLGVGLDASEKIPFAEPAGVDDASLIWRSYDPNGPEMGRLREALEAIGAEPGESVTVVLEPGALRMVRGVV